MAEVKAVSRVEAILNGEDITPVTRKEAILSGADVEPLSREEYFVQKRLGEGGGGLNYVIPEQTVTFPSSGKEVQLSDIGSLNELNDGDQVIIKIKSENGGFYAPATNDDGTIGSSAGGESPTILITKDGSNWKAAMVFKNPIFPFTAQISAIKGF